MRARTQKGTAGHKRLDHGRSGCVYGCVNETTELTLHHGLGGRVLVLAHQQGHLGEVVPNGVAPEAGGGLVGVGLGGGDLELGDHEPV